MNKTLVYVLCLGIAGLLLTISCRPERDFADAGSVLFDRDTVKFDTLFRNTPSPTQRLTITNNIGENLRIDQVRIANDPDSIFSLVLNGVPGRVHDDVELFEGDSVFAFFTMEAEVNNQHEIKEAYLEVEIGDEVQRILLYAPVLNAILLKDSLISTNTTLSGDTLYVVDGPVVVDQGAVLNIEPGAELHFTPRRDSNFNFISQLLVIGELRAQGTQARPILFTNNRFGGEWQASPGQWQGIHITRNSPGRNVLDWTIIQNGSIGVRVDSTDFSNNGIPKLQLSNSIIRHHANYGVLSLGFDPNLSVPTGQLPAGDPMIAGYNLCVYNCGQSSVAALGGGYNVYEHITAAEYGWDQSRSNPVLLYTNTLRFNDDDGNQVVETYDGLLRVANSIIYGSERNEVGIDLITESNNAVLNFPHNMTRAEEELAELLNGYEGIQLGEFNNYPEFDSLNTGRFPLLLFDLGASSPAIDAGLPLDQLFFQNSLGMDLYGNMREAQAPDLGAFERVD